MNPCPRPRTRSSSPCATSCMTSTKTLMLATNGSRHRDRGPSVLTLNRPSPTASTVLGEPSTQRGTAPSSTSPPVTRNKWAGSRREGPLPLSGPSTSADLGATATTPTAAPTGHLTRVLRQRDRARTRVSIETRVAMTGALIETYTGSITMGTSGSSSSTEMTAIIEECSCIHPPISTGVIEPIALTGDSTIPGGWT